jgi:hypothetical protein
MRIPSRTEQQKTVARAKCGNLYLKNQGISWVLDDESYFTLSHSTINGNDIFYSSNSAKTLASVKYTPVKKFEPKLLVWVCVSKKGISATIFRQSGMAVNKTVYKGFIKDGYLLRTILLRTIYQSASLRQQLQVLAGPGILTLCN